MVFVVAQEHVNNSAIFIYIYRERERESESYSVSIKRTNIIVARQNVACIRSMCEKIVRLKSFKLCLLLPASN